MSPPVVDVDIFIAGGGAAGLTLASRMALNGYRVAVASSSIAATAISTGRVLFNHDDPAVAEWASLFLTRFRSRESNYDLLERPTVAMTNIGTPLKQSLTNSSFDWTLEDRDVAVVGVIGNNDLDSNLTCLELRRSLGICARPLWISPFPYPTAANNHFVGELADILKDNISENTIVLPPISSDPTYALLTKLQNLSGKRVVEAATPLSLPGLRFQLLLEDVAEEVGVRLLKDRRLISIKIHGKEANEAVLSSGMRTIIVKFSALVLATGNLASGGLAVNGRGVIDPLNIFRVSSTQASGIHSSTLRNALSSGLDTCKGRAITKQGVVIRNVIPIGSLLKGVSYPLGYGLGEVMLEAWKSAPIVEDAL